MSIATTSVLAGTAQAGAERQAGHYVKFNMFILGASCKTPSARGRKGWRPLYVAIFSLLKLIFAVSES